MILRLVVDADVLVGELLRSQDRPGSVSPARYAQIEAVARHRIPRDPSDWPTVAAAIALDASIWTNDGDFLGCAVPVSTTQTLRLELQEGTA